MPIKMNFFRAIFHYLNVSGPTFSLFTPWRDMARYYYQAVNYFDYCDFVIDIHGYVILFRPSLFVSCFLITMITCNAVNYLQYIHRSIFWRQIPFLSPPPRFRIPIFLPDFLRARAPTKIDSR